MGNKQADCKPVACQPVACQQVDCKPVPCQQVDCKPVDCKPVNCSPVEGKPVENIYKNDLFDLEASIGENIDSKFKNNLLPLFQTHTLNSKGIIRIDSWPSFQLLNIIHDISKQFPNKTPLITIKITNNKNKNLETNPIKLIVEENSENVKGSIIAAGTNEKASELYIDFTKNPKFNVEGTTLTGKFKNITLINAHLDFFIDKELVLNQDNFIVQKKVIQKFENVSDNNNNFLLLLIVIFLIIVFVNGDRLMKMIKG
jgi:hypothetical protein